MRSTFKVLFYPKRETKKQQKVVPVMGRITINGKIAQFSATINVPIHLWEVKGGRAKGKSLEADRINRHLDNTRGQINKHYQSICDRETLVTAEKMRNAYMGFDKRYKTLLEKIPLFLIPIRLRRPSGYSLPRRNCESSKQRSYGTVCILSGTCSYSLLHRVVPCR